MEFLSITAQVAAQLRRELAAGHWSGTLPGVSRLAEELGVSRKTVDGALSLLEREGLLENRGRGRGRGIARSPKALTRGARKVAILSYDTSSRLEPDMIDLRHQVMEEGYQVIHPPKTLIGLGMKVAGISRMVREIEADAWIVGSASREVLKWFAGQDTPAFAFFGRRRTLPIAGAGPDHVAAGREVVRRLMDLGHRRIVILVRESQRTGGAGSIERTIFGEMKAHGVPVSSYNLPDWKDTPDEFHRVLEQLFQVTPPTALILDEPFLFHAAKDHLAQRGILAPAHVSLVCRDPDPTFAWCRPSVAHVRWDYRPVVRRAIEWVTNVAQGKRDIGQTLTKAEFVEGGTIGPAPETSG